MKKQALIYAIFLFAFANVSLAQKMIVKDSDSNVLMEVNDEGAVGSITLPSGAAPSTTTYKLYNVGGALYWSGSQLGLAGSAGGWTDDGTDVYLTTITDYIGIGTTSPGSKLEVAWEPPSSNINPIAVFKTIGSTSSAGAIRVQNTQGNQFSFGITPNPGNEFAIAYNSNINLSTDLFRITSAGNVGIGTTGPQNKLDVEGGMVVGTSYSGTETAPSNGLLIQGNVGIGDTSPTHTLDVAGKIGINNTQVLYLPDQTDFAGTLILGDGGGSLSHSEGVEGKWNTAVGIGALNANTIGTSNTASGYRALYTNDEGYCNTASGYYALYSNTTGNFNTASGYYALYSNTEGHRNTASGIYALYSNSTGNDNTASGRYALYSNTTGNNNTAIGYLALYSNTAGDDNTAIGYEANRYNETGSNNTIIGYKAGRGTVTHNKSGNVFIGYHAGYSETGSNKLYIENTSNSSPLIGGDFVADELYFNGDVGIGTTSPSSELDVDGDIEIGSSNAYYIGDPNTNGSWRIVLGAGDLHFQKRLSGSWVTKHTIY